MSGRSGSFFGLRIHDMRRELTRKSGSDYNSSRHFELFNFVDSLLAVPIVIALIAKISFLVLANTIYCRLVFDVLNRRIRKGIMKESSSTKKRNPGTTCMTHDVGIEKLADPFPPMIA